MSATFEYQRGETIVVALDAVSGDPATVTAITAKLKPLPGGANEIEAAAVPVADFVVTARVASGDIPAGWNLTLSATASAALLPGRYAADARLTVGGGIEIPSFIIIRIRESVSR